MLKKERLNSSVYTPNVHSGQQGNLVSLIQSNVYLVRSVTRKPFGCTYM